jgi:hypothetical protein
MHGQQNIKKSILNLNFQLNFGATLDTESFEQERRLAADKGTGRLTLAVE